MAITWQTPGAALVSAQSASSIAPSYPTGCVEGDKLLLVVGQRPSTVNSGSVSTPSSWNLVTSKLAAGGYGTTFAADTANTNLYVFERTVPAGGLSGTLTVSVSTNNVCWAQILRLTTSNGSWDSVAGTNGEDVTGGTAVSIACAANPGVTANDAILTAMCIPTDGHTGFSAYGATQSGVTFGTWTARSMTDSGTGNDIGGFVATCLVSSGTATGSPTITATAAGTTTNVRGPGAFVRVRESAKAASGSGSVAASAAASGAGAKAASGLGSVSASSAALASGARGVTGSASVPASATLSATGVKAEYSYDFTGSAAVGASASASASGTRAASGSGSLAASASASATGAKGRADLASSVCSAELSAGGIKGTVASPGIECAAATAASGAKASPGVASISSVADVQAIGSAQEILDERTGTASVASASSVSASGAKLCAESAAIVAVADITTAWAKAASSSSAIGADCAISVGGTKLAAGLAEILAAAGVNARGRNSTQRPITAAEIRHIAATESRDAFVVEPSRLRAVVATLDGIVRRSSQDNAAEASARNRTVSHGD